MTPSSHPVGAHRAPTTGAGLDVLVVDDSVVARRLIARLLETLPFVAHVRAVASGELAVARIRRAPVDLVLLDMEMEGMDGLQTLTALRTIVPDLHVIMLSRHTIAGARVTIEALALGATDWVSKPIARDPLDADGQLRRDLVPRLEALWRDRTGRAAAPRDAGPPPALALGVPTVVGVAASTGGPKALAALLGPLPATLPFPLLVVQHMPSNFTGMFAERLNARSALTIREAYDGAIARPGEAWVAPGGKHMTVEPSADGVRLRLDEGPLVQSVRPSADRLFESIATTFGRRAMVIVLTGMGRDGRDGAEAIRGAGGAVAVQDADTSVVWGMPGAVHKAGLAQWVMPLEAMSGFVEDLAGGHTPPPLPPTDATTGCGASADPRAWTTKRATEPTDRKYSR